MTCALAALILFIRLPGGFTHPELWAEDAILISDAYNHGLASLDMPLAGSLNLYGRLVANLAVQLPPLYWPWITMYGAHAAALVVVFLITSPRFDLPYKHLAALGVVAAPMREVFNGLTNTQWVLCIGLFALAFFNRGQLRAKTLVAESGFAVIAGLDGPFAAFILPIYAMQIWRAGENERKRLVILSAIIAVCAIIQISYVADNLRVFNLIEPKPYDHVLWLIMPSRWLDAVRLASIFVHHQYVLIIAVVIGLPVLLWFSSREPYRSQKVGMILFAGLVLYSGLYKYRNNLELLSNDRYVYAGAVFSFWFLCIASAASHGLRQMFGVSVVVLLICVSTIRRANEIRPTATTPWAEAVT